MTIFIALTTIIQTFSISLGVGSSTLAIANFFTAIADGVIDETERRMMGIVYTVLRVAMVLILVTTVLLVGLEFSYYNLVGFSAFSIAQLMVILVLFVNAMLMTAHLMPTTFGPAIQGGNWYTLGTLTGLQLLGYTSFTYAQFFMCYITWLILAVVIVNGLMLLMRSKKEKKKEAEQE